MGFLFLAQSAEKVEQGLGWLERVQAGGVPLIALVVAVICGAFAYWQLKQNNELRKEQVEDAKAREATQKADAAARAKEQAEETKARMSEQEALLREMLDRDREAQEGQLATAKALQGITEALRDLREEVRRRST